MSSSHNPACPAGGRRLKVLSLSTLLTTLKPQVKTGKRTVFTNGCFDVLHVGHTRYLQKARALGDLLIVGVNADASVRKIKGPGRPVNAEAARAEVLAALECVDYVVLFSEPTPLKLIESIRPQVLVKGGDWRKERIVGWQFVESYGGRVRSLPFVKGFSSTKVLEKITAL